MQRTGADAKRKSKSGSSSIDGDGAGPDAKTSRGGGGTSCTPQSAATSFFIIQELVIAPSGGYASPSPSRDGQQQQQLSSSQFSAKKKSRKKDRTAPSSPLSPTSREDNRTRVVETCLSPSSSSDAILQGVHEESDFEGEDIHMERDEQRRRQKHAPSSSSSLKTAPLSILNRVGSAPGLPLHSSVSAGVYSLSKKRNLMKSASPNGAGPHLVAMQRSRLILLPINIQTGTLMRDPALDRKNRSNNNSAEITSSQRGALSSVDQLQQQQLDDKPNGGYAIASLKQRLSQMEKEVTRDLKLRQSLEKQVGQLTRESQCTFAEKQQLQAKVEQLEKSVLQQKHSFEKLSDRYASVYSNLQKLAEQQSSSPDNHTGSIQAVLQALTRENQEFQRKLRVLEARHVEDKALAANQEKKIKRLRAEMEALQHMNEANNRDDASEVHSEYSYKSPSDLKQLQPALSLPTTEGGGSPTRTVAVGGGLSSHSSTSGSANSSSAHLIGTKEYQYIDPNILKVLEKVDSQFSITNAINLSVVLKKWLNSCLHVVSSTHIPSVLQQILRRMCELLHCKHAALFEVNYAERMLVGRYCESGGVNWELPLDKGIIGYAARQNALCNVQRAYDDPRFYSSTDTITGIPSREVLCIPLVQELQPGQPNSVFAVLQAWNTTHQKPFTPNDQILGGLLTIQAGTVFLQTKVTKTLQKINNKLLQIIHMHQEIVQDESMNVGASESPNSLTKASVSSGGVSSCSISFVHLVANAQKQFSECIGIKKLKIFVLDSEVMKIWHVGSETDANGQVLLVRRYSNVLSSLCGLVLKSSSGLILEDPISKATFNDTVDLKGGAGGMYLVPIMSPWGATPLGMIQVARSSSHSAASVKAVVLGVDPGFTAAVAKEKQGAQASDDLLNMELIDVFSRVFASLLHHVKAQQLYDTWPKEIQDARLAYITDRLDCLESEYAREQEEADEEEARLERMLAATAMMEQRILESAQRERTQSGQGREQNLTALSTSPAQHAPEVLVVEKDTVRRASYTETAIYPQSSSYSCDARRVSSAGSTRKSVTFHNEVLDPAAHAPDTLYVEREEEEEEGGGDPLDAAENPEEDGASISDGENDSEQPEFVTDEPEIAPLDLARESAVDDDERLDAEESWRVLDGMVAEQPFDAEIAGYDGTDPYQLQPQGNGDGGWCEETLNLAGDDDIGSDWQQQDDQPGGAKPWPHGQEEVYISGMDPDSGLESGHSELQEGEGAFWQEEQETSPLDNDDAGHEWQDGGENEESSLWYGDRGENSDQSPIGLISTDSMYAIDLNYSDGSPAEVTNAGDSDSFSPVDEQPGDIVSSLFEL